MIMNNALSDGKGSRKVLAQRAKYTKEYGLFKFRIFPYDELKSFLSLNGETSTLKKILSDNIEKYYHLINAPGENEWLMTQKEYGQTFLEFARGGGYKMISNKRNMIYILNVKVVLLKDKSNEDMNNDKDKEENVIINSFDSTYVNELITILQGYYVSIPFKSIEIVLTLTEREYLRNSWGDKSQEEAKDMDNKDNEEVNKRRQINGTYIMLLLYNYIPNKAYCSIAILNKDMYYINKEGDIETCYELRNITKRLSLLSTARFNPLFYFKPITIQEEENKKKLESISFKRQLKLIIRNIGLMFGLMNCIFFSCIMNGFNYLNEFDVHPLELCPICLRKVFSVILSEKPQLEKSQSKNAIVLYQRFDNLKTLLTNTIHKEAFTQEVNWYKQRYDDLTKII